MSESLAIYPGSFDPITNGHLDLIERARRVFGSLIVAVLTNPDKLPLFTVMERVEMLQEATRGMPNVAVDTFGGLLVEYAKQKGAGIILRGIRAFTDYEYELQMAIMNRKLEPSLETVFLVPAEDFASTSRLPVGRRQGRGRGPARGEAERCIPSDPAHGRARSTACGPRPGFVLDTRGVAVAMCRSARRFPPAAPA